MLFPYWCIVKNYPIEVINGTLRISNPYQTTTKNFNQPQKATIKRR